MRTSESEEGITLVEIMISLVVLGIVLTTFFEVITGGLRSLSDSGSRQESSQLATEAIEVLRVLSPPEIALYVDPVLVVATEIDLANLSDCTAQVDDDGDGTVDRTPLGYDPDGTGPLACEEFVTSDQGAIKGATPYHGTVDGVTVTTVSTASAVAGVQNGVTRVTVLLEYELAGGPKQIRRQALFSEVSRG